MFDDMMTKSNCFTSELILYFDSRFCHFISEEQTKKRSIFTRLSQRVPEMTAALICFHSLTLNNKCYRLYELKWFKFRGNIVMISRN